MSVSRVFHALVLFGLAALTEIIPTPGYAQQHMGRLEVDLGATVSKVTVASADSRTQQLPKATEALQLAQSAQFYGEHHIARNTRFRPVRNNGEKLLLRTVAGCETGPPSSRTIAGAPKLESERGAIQKCTEETGTDSATANV